MKESTKENNEFMECDICRQKPGSPYLCIGCLHNRKVINRLTKKHLNPELKVECQDLESGEMVKITNIMWGNDDEVESVSILYSNGERAVRFQGEDLRIKMI